MTIPASIFTALTSLEAQVAAASPLVNAPFSTIVALQLNAANLVASVQTTLTATPNLLDTWVSPTDALSIISGVLNLTSIAEDQSNLSLMRGVVGRAASNLDQLP